MAQKAQEKGVTGPAPVVDAPGKVRNVVLVGHSGAGKTTLVEALLAATGTISRAGSVTDGTTVSDHDPAAVRQQRSVSLACAPFMHDGVKVNLLDTPGYADFVGELRAGLRAADAALFVVSAVDGMDAATAALWEECAAVGMPRAVAISRLDHPRADFDDTLAQCQRGLRRRRATRSTCRCSATTASRVVGLMGLITQRVFDYSKGYPPEVREPDAEHLPAIEDARNELIEGIIAESEDETLMDRYLGGEEIETSILIEDLEKAVARGTLLPGGPGLRGDQGRPRRAAGAAHQRVPVAAGARRCPRSPGWTARPARPADLRPGRPAGGRGGQDHDRLVRRPGLAGPGLLRHAAPGDHRARLRARHGGARPPRPRRRRAGRAPLLAARRPAARGALRVAGDICAITKSGTAETGDTLSTKDNPLLMGPWDMPEPLLPVAIVAKTRSDEDALAKNLGRLVAGDPTMRLERNPETHQLVLWCMGEAHADVVLDRLRAGGVELDTEPVKVALRETFAAAVQGPRPARQAVRRARPVRRLRHRGRAAAARLRLRVRRQGGRRRGAAQLHPVGGEGRAGPDGARPRRRPPGGRPPGHPLRRQGAQRRLLRRRVPDRRRAGAARRRPRRARSRCSSRSTR